MQLIKSTVAIAAALLVTPTTAAPQPRDNIEKETTKARRDTQRTLWLGQATSVNNAGGVPFSSIQRETWMMPGPDPNDDFCGRRGGASFSGTALKPDWCQQAFSHPDFMDGLEVKMGHTDDDDEGSACGQGDPGVAPQNEARYAGLFDMDDIRVGSCYWDSEAVQTTCFSWGSGNFGSWFRCEAEDDV